MRLAIFVLVFFVTSELVCASLDGYPKEQKPAVSEQSDSELTSLKGPLIEKIDWEDKPVSEAVAELVDLVVKRDKNSPWRNVQIRKDHEHSPRVTMHLRNVSASEAFQAVATVSLGKMMLKNGTVELVWPDPTTDRVDEFGIEIRVVIVPQQAARRLGLTASRVKQSLERFGVKFSVEGSLALYSEKTGELLLKAPPEECALAAALILLVERTDVVVKSK